MQIYRAKSAFAVPEPPNRNATSPHYGPRTLCFPSACFIFYSRPDPFRDGVVHILRQPFWRGCYELKSIFIASNASSARIPLSCFEFIVRRSAAFLRCPFGSPYGPSSRPGAAADPISGTAAVSAAKQSAYRCFRHFAAPIWGLHLRALHRLFRDSS